MDPQLSSILTSVGMAVATSVAAWAASKGVIPDGDQSVLANQLVLLGGGLVTAALGWYKARQNTQAALVAKITPAAAIAKVNADENGVKVVSENALVPQVDAPLKGPGSK